MTKEETKVTQRSPIESAAISAEEAFRTLVPEKIWLREIGFALQILRSKESSFRNCIPATIRDAVINVALTGATLNPALAQAFLIPRTIKGKGLCCILEFSYRGLANIAVKSGSVLDIDSTVVYTNDNFYMEQGLEPVLKHKPTLDADRGDVLGVYAVAILHQNIKKFIWLPKEDIEKARAVSKAKDSLMWNTFYGEGARKTAVKKLYKLLPQTDEMGTAVALANEVEGIDFEKERSEKGAGILDRFNKDKPKELESPVEEESQSTEEELDDVPSAETLDFEARLKDAETVDALDMIFAEYELTKPAGKDLVILRHVRDTRAQEIKGNK